MLDSETNLKVKQALSETADLVSPQQITHFRGFLFEFVVLISPQE